jgi:hypothetical protein
MIDKACRRLSVWPFEVRMLVAALRWSQQSKTSTDQVTRSQGIEQLELTRPPLSTIDKFDFVTWNSSWSRSSTPLLLPSISGKFFQIDNQTRHFLCYFYFEWRFHFSEGQEESLFGLACKKRRKQPALAAANYNSSVPFAPAATEWS